MAKNKQSFGAASGFFNEEKNTRGDGDRNPKKDVVDDLPEVQDENRVQKTIGMTKTARDTLNIITKDKTNKY